MPYIGMSKMDILNKDIKGITGKVVIGFTVMIASVLGSGYAVYHKLDNIEYSMQIRDIKQSLTDSLQNRDIKEIRLVRK